MSRPVLEQFERSFVFRLTRFLAIALVFVLMAAVSVSGMMLTRYLQNSDSRVAADEVVKELKPKDQSSGSETSTTAATGLKDEKLKIPFNLQKYLADSNSMSYLTNWLSPLPQGQKESFLKELSDTVDSAEKNNLDAYAAINKYHELKVQKLERAREQESERNNYIMLFAGTTATSLILISLLSVTLVLLAVERNTRPSTT